MLTFDLRPLINLGGGVYVKNTWLSFIPIRQEISSNHEDLNPSEVEMYHKFGFAESYIYMSTCTNVMLDLVVAQPLAQCPFAIVQFSGP